MDPYSPPEADIQASVGEPVWARPIRWSVPVVIGIVGILGFWGTTLVVVAVSSLHAMDGKRGLVLGLLGLLAGVAHLAGIMISLLRRKGNWLVGLIVNGLPLAVIVAMIVAAASKKT